MGLKSNKSRPSWTSRFAGVIACIGMVTSAQAMIADGKFSAGEYSNIFAVDYDFGTQGTHTGFFAFGTDSATSNQFIYFAAPKEFVDNSYDAVTGNGSAAIGWGSTDHSFDKLLGSDHAVFNLNTVGGALDIKVDYIATDDKNNPTVYRSAGIADKNNTPVTGGDDISGIDPIGKDTKADGALLAGDASVIQEIATSLEWNLNHLSGYATTSPTAAGSGVTDTNDPNYGSYANASEPDWIYEVGYEIEFSAGTFDTAKFSSGLVSDAQDLFTLASIHASPHKIGASNDIVPMGTTTNCQDLPDPKPAFCTGGGSQTGGNANAVPEPGTLVLMGVALAGMGASRKRRSSRSRKTA